ncbi:hypothetical protein [Robertmurraya korlensis]|uniref:hypothetical protein n=1 Tax=Robertmurraya korlensis TaxID=519977 RepID=UPI00082650C5|nr:hypothetical protein [Robertmurraya korlensis]
MGNRYRNGDVAGAFDRRRCDRNGDVAGAMDNRRRRDNRNGDVLGAFDEVDIPRVRVRGYVDEEDLCRAVRRCLLNDLVAGAQDDRDDHDHCCCHRRRR